MLINIKSKRRAFSILESIIIFTFVLLIASLSLKIISNNYLKSQSFTTYEDLRSLEIEEEKLLLIINNKSKNINFSKDELLNEIKVISKKYPELKNISFVYENEDYYLKRRERDSVKYIKLDNKVNEGGVFFLPSGYKTKYIIIKE